MFAHQVIEDMKMLINKDDYAFFKKPASRLIPFIINSQKFHIGEGSDICDCFKKDFGKPLFTEYREYLRLPYKLCWFDYYTNTFKEQPKNGILVHEGVLNKWFIWMFTYTVTYKIWTPKFLSYYLDFSGEYPKVKVFSLENTPPGTIDDLSKEDDADFSILHSAILLLNTKNIVTEEHHPPEKLNKKRRKLGKQELFTYKTLKVVVPSRSRSAGDSLKTDIHHRIHLCRGHFKEYTAENPLFGKHTGLYWWQPHVRGKSKDGIVMKDYDIKTRSEE